MEYARHFHFFDEASATKDSPKHNKETNSGWLFDVLEFSALAGKRCPVLYRWKTFFELEESAKTGILVAYDYSLIGVLGVADLRKREAAVLVEGLKKMNVMPVMVTGDNWRTARAVAREVCI
nr:copper-transporting atpase ran1 [Quercus suber]